MSKRHVTHRDVQRFTEGDCHIFARAVHKLTGWPINVLVTVGGDEIHAFCLAPDGRHVDIEGASPAAEHMAAWDCYTRRPTACKGWGNRFGQHSYDRARAVAPLVVAS